MIRGPLRIQGTVSGGRQIVRYATKEPKAFWESQSFLRVWTKAKEIEKDFIISLLTSVAYKFIIKNLIIKLQSIDL